MPVDRASGRPDSMCPLKGQRDCERPGGYGPVMEGKYEFFCHFKSSGKTDCEYALVEQDTCPGESVCMSGKELEKSHRAGVPVDINRGWMIKMQ